MKIQYDQAKIAKFLNPKTKYPITWIAITTTIQFISLICFIIFTTSGVLYPGQTYSINVTDWLNTHWTVVESTAFSEMFAANGWLWMQQSLIFFSISSFIFLILMQVLTSFHYSTLHQLDSKNYKKGNLQAIFGIFFFWKWIALSRKFAGKDLQIHLFGDGDLESIDPKGFWLAFVGKEKIDKKWLLTLLFYLMLFCSAFVWFVTWIDYSLAFADFEKIYMLDPLKFVQDNSQAGLKFKIEFIDLRPITGTFAYFTNLGNFACFFYALVRLVKPKAFMFRNNSLTIQLGTYITIVGFVFWTVLFNWDSYKDNPLDFVLTIFSHGLTPLSFAVYTIAMCLYNKAQPYPFWKSWKYFVVFPLSYGVLLYLTPVFSVIAIYGGLTNLNPGHENIGDTYGQFGSPVLIIGILGFLVAFALFYFLFWIVPAIKSKTIQFNSTKK